MMRVKVSSVYKKKSGPLQHSTAHVQLTEEDEITLIRAFKQQQQQQQQQSRLHM